MTGTGGRWKAAGRTEPPLAPDLPVPDHIRSALRGVGREVVLGQGFTEAELGLRWWTQNLGPEFEELRVDLGGAPEVAAQLRRTDLMALARDVLIPDSSDVQVLELLWYTLAWGSGTSRRQNRRRIDAFRDEEQRRTRTELLRVAAAAAAAGDVTVAYGTLIRRGGGVIPGLGPAFFTKFLYFAGGGDVDHPAAILDARVARSLHRLGWSSLPSGWANWFTATYVSYCDLLGRWAEEVAQDRGAAVGRDELEYLLFRWGGHVPTGG